MTSSGVICITRSVICARPVIRGTVIIFVLAHTVPVLDWSSESTIRERLETVISSTVHVTIDDQIELMALKRSVEPEVLMSPPAKSTRHGRPRFNRALRHHVLPIAKRRILRARNTRRQHIVASIPQLTGKELHAYDSENCEEQQKEYHHVAER